MTSAGSDRTVQGAGVALATTDHGVVGGGDPAGRPSVVLLHGLGGSRAGMRRLVAHLTGWRVVTADLRGHGDSSSGPWSFEAARADLDAVVAAYTLERPWVAGHSLGGMVALDHVRAGRSVAGAVNVDGWGPGLAQRYVGEDGAQVQRVLDEVAEGRLPTRLTRWAASRSRQHREGFTGQVLASLHGLDLVAWHREAPLPTLAFNATAPSGLLTRLAMGSQHARFSAAHRLGLRRDLALAAAAQPGLTVVEVDATHALHRTHAADVAAAFQALVGAGA